jgi:hypothetical protein
MSPPHTPPSLTPYQQEQAATLIKSVRARLLAEVRWSRKFGQVGKLGSPFLEDGPDDGQAEEVFG